MSVAAMNGPPVRYMSVNGVEYPAAVAAHIPKYYLPKAHLQKQKYPDSAVLRCYVDPDVVAEARATYARYAEQVLEEAARNPYGPKFRSKDDVTAFGAISQFRFGGGVGARSAEIPTAQQLVLEWDDDNLPADSVEQPLLDKRGPQARAEPLLVRVPASATPSQALPIVLKTIIAEVKVRLRELHQQANGRRSPPSRALTPTLDGTDAPPAFTSWTPDGLKKLRSLCEEQLDQLEREARAANDALQANATPEQKRTGRRGTGRRSGKPSKAASAKVPVEQSGEDGMPPLEPPSVGFRPCDVNGSILAPDPPAGANQPAPQTSKANAQTPSRRNRRGSVNFGNVGGVSPSRPTPPGAFGLGMPALGGLPQTPAGANRCATPSGPQPLSPMAGASASSPAVTKHCVVRRVLDAATPLSQQLTMPFNIAITVDRGRAREFVRHANVAARVVQQREVQARQARRSENIAGREARVQQMEEESRNESLARDEVVREAIRHQQSTSLKEVGIWQRERAAAERNARLEAEADAKRRMIESEEAAIEAALHVIAAAKASCSMDEAEARNAVTEAERSSRAALLGDATACAGTILKRLRIRERMRLVPGITERVVLGQHDVVAGSRMFA
jgi:hypothetical protein